MHLPAHETVMRHFRYNDDLTVSVPVELFRRFLRLAACGGGFDEAWYTAAYDDVAKALHSNSIESGLAHFGDGGYFEGRRPKIFDVDEGWYLQRYPDVAAGVAAGAIVSGHAHYNQSGYLEGRVPQPQMVREIEEWNELIGRLGGVEKETVAAIGTDVGLASRKLPGPSRRGASLG